MGRLRPQRHASGQECGGTLGKPVARDRPCEQRRSRPGRHAGLAVPRSPVPTVQTKVPAASPSARYRMRPCRRRPDRPAGGVHGSALRYGRPRRGVGAIPRCPALVLVEQEAQVGRAAESHTAFRGSPHRVSGIPTGRVTRYVRVPRQRPRRLSVQELATPEQETGIHPRWYVLVTSATGKSVFATMGPYRSENGARHAADGARVVHYRVGQARSQTGSFGSSGARTGPGVGGVRFRHT